MPWLKEIVVVVVVVVFSTIWGMVAGKETAKDEFAQRQILEEIVIEKNEQGDLEVSMTFSGPEFENFPSDGRLSCPDDGNTCIGIFPANGYVYRARFVIDGNFPISQVGYSLKN